MKKTVVLGVTSGIAAYKSIELIELLKQEGIDVHVVMTDAATKMVNPNKFQKASGNKVHYQLFERGFNYKDILKIRKVDHIDLADRADVIVIAPATANTLSKLAQGIADDFLTTMVLAASSPLLLCPSMNVHMWHNPIVQENIAKLKKAGFTIIDPEKGMLACGYEGQGRLAHLEIIKKEILSVLNRSKKLQGKKILVTAGGTIEKIDDVRYIANRSSGKMGIAIAEECFLQGADVLLLRAKSSVSPRYRVKEEIFETTEDLLKLVQKYAKKYDILFHVAAVSDFAVAKKSGKIASGKKLTLNLQPQVKISDQIKKLNPKIQLILFKAEWGLNGSTKTIEQKFKDSNADVVVVNDVSKKDRGFESDMNEVSIISADGKIKKISLRSKNEIAQKLIEHIVHTN